MRRYRARAQPAGAGPACARSPPAPRDTIGTQGRACATGARRADREPRKFLGWLQLSFARRWIASVAKDIQIRRISLVYQAGLLHQRPFDPIHKPAISDMLDYEGEMAVVTGDGAATCAPPQRTR